MMHRVPGIVSPASIDPVSGYRYYARSQVQGGVTVDFLRRVQVPLSELAAAPDTATKSGNGQMVLARPGPANLDLASRDLIAGRVHS